ncbi:putative riboflavin kinase isoform X2 [Neodiprion pinetum]|nr:putative riboflavin kinase isoform X2 [Neodiprion fabricii]XP_046410048.1 putative riboflavin kinase isoform X2 [Neodiprion fabricii]XP_046410049.1 putative riboflavin kinase isoform X2 [Neodiprion fabricii]XP_046465631.1 putative riboflavin kinase isoform X2 [Neodiprion pinetum]XP_046586136.1 putative riboflavin kinase isoform X2 [Neodiprion lecontei]XP_046603511.1 putative riboflavin kinase isoform X2 [Neodiprion virginianus]
MSSTGLPHFSVGKIVKGFGRGSKELGIPTANFPTEVVQNLPPEIGTGIYYGWASVDRGDVHKMVMSIGWNPFFQNTQKSMETHIIHKYPGDLYGLELRVVILGFLRPEADFTSIEDLIAEIKGDIENAKKCLDEPEMAAYKTHTFFTDPASNTLG